MTFEQLRSWWLGVCPKGSKDVWVRVHTKDDDYSNFSVEVSYDGVMLKIEGKTADEVHTKALRMIGDKPEFKTRNKMLTGN